MKKNLSFSLIPFFLILIFLGIPSHSLTVEVTPNGVFTRSLGPHGQKVLNDIRKESLFWPFGAGTENGEIEEKGIKKGPPFLTKRKKLIEQQLRAESKIPQSTKRSRP